MRDNPSSRPGEPKPAWPCRRNGRSVPKSFELGLWVGWSLPMVFMAIGFGWSGAARGEDTLTNRPTPILRIIKPAALLEAAQPQPQAPQVGALPTAEPSMPAKAPVAAPTAWPASNGVPSFMPGFPRAVRGVLEEQVALARAGLCPGSIDGVNGPQTRLALRAFQTQTGLKPSGELDPATLARLQLERPVLTNYIVASNDLARLQPLQATWLGKSRQSALEYESLLELVAERAHAHPNLVRRLNQTTNWTNVAAGTVLRIPDTDAGPTTNKAAFLIIRLGQKTLEAFDSETNLLAHFPCSIAQRVEKRPAGELHVTVIAPDPNYTFDPEVFPESPEARQIKSKLVLPPGPNNPVGVAWIGLDRAGYGIHGTPSPEQVGRTESHGCFRLANWNAERLVRLVFIGMPVYVEP